MTVPAPDQREIFDLRAVRRHRARAALRNGDDFLFAEAEERLVERLDEVNRRFPVVLNLGARSGRLAGALRGRGGIAHVFAMDPSSEFLARQSGLRLAGELEALPFAPASFDLVIGALALHWINDLPGALLQLRHALRPDGLLLVSLLGGETLGELRRAFMEAELEAEGGVSPRVSPFAEIRDLGGLLQRAGFALPVADSDRITATYADPLALMRELRLMGESNAVRERRQSFSRRATLARAAARYQALFGQADGRVPATFEIVTLTAWAPHDSQPKPLRPGSAAARLAEALGTTEQPAGDRASPHKR
jgi:SAM-dependent methyltransferase